MRRCRNCSVGKELGSTIDSSKMVYMCGGCGHVDCAKSTVPQGLIAYDENKFTLALHKRMHPHYYSPPRGGPMQRWRWSATSKKASTKVLTVGEIDVEWAAHLGRNVLGRNLNNELQVIDL